MRRNAFQPAPPAAGEPIDPLPDGAELSEADLEHVVGGLTTRYRGYTAPGYPPFGEATSGNGRARA
jgi:hypothetical protein